MDALLAIVLNVIGDDSARFNVNLSSDVPSLDLGGAQIRGAAPIAKHIAREAGLLLPPPEAAPQLDQWLSLSGQIARRLAGKEGEAAVGVLEELNAALVMATFLASQALTLADIALYAAVAPTMQRLSTQQRFQVNRVARHFDLTQHLLHDQLAKSPAKLPFPLLAIDLNRPAVEAKKEKKEAAAAPAKAKEAAPAKAKEAAVAAEAKAPEAAAAEKKGKKEKASAAPKEDKPAKAEAGGSGAAPPSSGLPAGAADPSKIDFRVGLILSAAKHPDADSLYVEQIDIGEAKPRQVCSGLVKYIPSADLLVGKKIVVIANLKPAKMRGVESQAMLLAAESEDGATVELVLAPEGSAPGDRVTVEGYTGEPDAQLNPKHKRWEAVQPHLRTSEGREAVFLDPNDGGKAKLLRTEKGTLIAPTLVGAKLR
ncbi:hypothetical protein DFJ74DRAFT_288128 [Hyaloraphidium curvatum]|nr:hypothetical protein DFJ74DRAFT_288128 [Hyaloraphidium curvatum]